MLAAARRQARQLQNQIREVQAAAYDGATFRLRSARYAVRADIQPAPASEPDGTLLLGGIPPEIAEIYTA
jgi:hypothetical protein